MGFHKVIGVLALGIASYALYKTGALRPLTKCTVAASAKASEWTGETINTIKDKSKCLSEKITTQVNELKEKTKTGTEKNAGTTSKA